MVDIKNYNSYEDFINYYESIKDRAMELSYRMKHSREVLLKKLKKERNKKLSSLKKQLSTEELSIMREELYQKRDLELAKLAIENAAKVEEVLLLRKEMVVLNRIFEDIKSLRSQKTNEEWLNIIKTSMEDAYNTSYSIQIMDRPYTMVGIGTHSDFPYESEDRMGTMVVVVRDGCDMLEFPEGVFSYPEAYPRDYDSHDFVLYDVFDEPLEDSVDYLMKQNAVYELPGMGVDAVKLVDDLLFQEYKETLIEQKKKIK